MQQESRMLITGATGQLGSYVLQLLQAQQAHTFGWSKTRSGIHFGCPVRPVDLTNRDAVSQAFREARPNVILHVAAQARVDTCYERPDAARVVNVEATQQLVQLAAAAEARLVYVSTDLVFDGQRGNYCEQDEPRPLSVYGQTKLAAERIVMQYANALVVRVSLLYGPSLSDRPTFFDQQCMALRSGQTCRLFVDEWRTPLSLPNAAAALVALLPAGRTGLLHVGGSERLSRWDMGQLLAQHLGAPESLLVPTRRDAADAAEPRPADVSLDSRLFHASFPQLRWHTYTETLRQLIP